MAQEVGRGDPGELRPGEDDDGRGRCPATLPPAAVHAGSKAAILRVWGGSSGSRSDMPEPGFLAGMRAPIAGTRVYFLAEADFHRSPAGRRPPGLPKPLKLARERTKPARAARPAGGSAGSPRWG